MVKITDILFYCIAWLTVSATLPACTQTDEPVPGGDGGGKTMSFKFNIYTYEKAPASRAPGVWEEDAVNAAERILNIDDMRVLLFDQSGVLLKSVTPAYLDYHGGSASNDGYYTLSVAFTHEYFDKFDDNADIPFTVMILANLRGAGGIYADYTPGRTRVADIADSFRIAPEWYPDETGGIPMYGIKGFVLPKTLLMQGIDAPAAGQIDLLRSLCKIEVTDRIANAVLYPDGEKYPRVIGVDMVSWVDNGYIRPLYDDYAQGLRYANIYPSAPVETGKAGTPTGGLYRFYCPEAAVGDMKFRVTAILAPGEAPRVYETGLEPFEPAIGSELVRNHIYRFNVHALNTIADLTVSVSDWIVETDEFELDNMVSMEPDGFMKWDYDPADFAVSTETYQGKEEQQLSILNGTTGCATGTFHIISPKGATWKAYFIPGENGVDAFEFVDTDGAGNPVPGSERVYAEGIVGTPATIHIRGKGAADSYRHWAELVIEVKTADGTILYAPLTSAMSSRIIIYRENRL